MEISLEMNRKEFYPDRTIGGFYDETGRFRWYTLEDKDRKLEEGGIKVFGQTAIPRGRYKLEFDWSPKHTALMPFLRNVLQFDAIEVHIGVKPEDTDGCVLLGRKYDTAAKTLFESTLACQEFYPWLLEKVVESGNDVWLTVS